MRWKERFFVNVGEDCGAPPRPLETAPGGAAWTAGVRLVGLPACLHRAARRGAGPNAQAARPLRASHQPPRCAHTRARRPAGLAAAGFLRPDGVAQA
jgi:hypothetical protein